MMIGASEEAKKDELCQFVSSEVSAFNDANEKSYSEKLVWKRAGIFLEFVIVGAAGGLLGLLVGLIGWAITGSNPLKQRWWMPAWIFGAIGLSRVLLAMIPV